MLGPIINRTVTEKLYCTCRAAIYRLGFAVKQQTVITWDCFGLVSEQLEQTLNGFVKTEERGWCAVIDRGLSRTFAGLWALQKWLGRVLFFFFFSTCCLSADAVQLRWLQRRR